MFDIIVKAGRVIDGSGAGPLEADVAIKDGRIAAIGNLSSELANYTIQAEGQVVCPGFIDMHTHSDFNLIQHRRAESAIRQGITTEVIGNCGFSGFPVKEETAGLINEHIKGVLADMEVDLSAGKDYLTELCGGNYAVNVAPLLGHGTLRMAVMGFENRPPTAAELAEMKELVEHYMARGVFGLSTGLIYAPSCYGETDEIIELATVVAKYGGFYASHIRGEGDSLEDAVAEAIGIGRAAAVPVHLSHLKAAGKANWGKMKSILEMIDAAREQGQDVTGDFYPYLAGATFLHALLPPWLLEKNGVRGAVKQLREQNIRERVRQDIENNRITNWWNPIRAAGGWEKVMVAGVQGQTHKWCEGLNFSHIAAKKERDIYDTVFDLLIAEDGQVLVIIEMMVEENLRRALRHPFVAVGSDGWSEEREKSLGKNSIHPRHYGTFPRILGKYVREEKEIQLEQAIRKMTSLPAQRLGLNERGMLKAGMAADIVVFDPHTIVDTATYTEPRSFPRGINYVLVNGEIVVTPAGQTGAIPGRLLLRQPGC